MKKYFLAKSEPNSYSIEDLENDNITWWDGVHNYSALITIKSWKIGDQIYFYRSLKEPAVVGLMEVISEPIFDVDDIRQISYKAQVKFISKFENPIYLKQIKESNLFQTFALVKNSRLSVMACTNEFCEYIDRHNKPVI